MAKKLNAMLPPDLESVWTLYSNGYVYKSGGEDTFFATKYKHYSKELKQQAVLDYFSGRGSLQQICQRYGIRAKSNL